MPRSKTIAPLPRRKQELIAQSDLCRALLAVEFQNFRVGVASLTSGFDVLRQPCPYWLGLLPLVGLWLARNRRSLSRLVKNAAGLYWSARVLRTVWKRLTLPLNRFIPP